MDIWQIDKLALFLIFFIPGFVSISIYDLVIASGTRDFSKSIFEAVGYSCINFALLSWLIIIIHKDNFLNSHPVWYLVSLLAILFIFPVIWPALGIKIRKLSWLSRFVLQPEKTPWDSVFSKRKSYWVIIHLKDGRKVGGKYSSNSYTSAFPHEHEIYLEEAWKLNEKGGFKEKVDRTKGIIIFGDEIISLELFK